MLAAGMASSPAQVYSINIVGYINLTVNPGLNLIVNQLIAESNDLGSFIPSVPDGTVVFRYDPQSQSYLDGVTFLNGLGWYAASGDSGDPVRSIPLGEAFFLQIPGSNTTTVTFVGEVMLDSVNPIPGNYSLKGSVLPLAGALAADVSFPPVDGDRVYQWDSLLQRFKTPAAYSVTNANLWQPGEPQITVGEGLLVFRNLALATPANYWSEHLQIGPAPAVKSTLTTATVSPAPAIQRLIIGNGAVTLDVSNPGGTAYDVQVSTDGAAWTTLAQNQTGAQWLAPFTGNNKGYFRLRVSVD